MGKLVVAGTTAALLCGVLSGCRSQSPLPAGSTPMARGSDTATAQETSAVAALRDWLEHPRAGTLTVSSVDTVSGGKTVVSRRLSGAMDFAAGTASLTGTRTTLTTSNAQESALQAIEADGRVYTSIPADESSRYPGKKWLVDDLSMAQPAGSRHAVWWAALDALQTVHVDGPSEVDGKSAVEYTGTVDLAQATGMSMAKLNAQSDIFQKAGTTKVSIDIYTDLGTGALVGFSYRLGLKVSVDALATATSTAGYQVDLIGFGQPATPSPTQAAVPPARLVTTGGSGDLCRLLLF